MKVLWDVDTQVDFMYPHGKLYVPGAEDDHSRDAASRRRCARRPGIVHVASVDDHELTDAEIADEPDFQHVSTALPAWHTRCAEDPRDRPGRSRSDHPGALPERYLEGREFLIPKKTFDVFTNPNTDRLLDRLDPDEIVVFGVATDVCDDAAIRGFLARGREGDASWRTPPAAWTRSARRSARPLA